MNSEFHPSLDVLELHLLSRLPKGESTEIEDHLTGCGKCRVMAGEMMRQFELIVAATGACEL